MNPKESWKWAGPDWKNHISGAVSAIDGVEIQSDNPKGMFESWCKVLGDPKVDIEKNIIFLDNTWLKFVRDNDGRGPGVSTFSLKTDTPEAVMKRAENLGMISDGCIMLGGVKFYLTS